MEVRYRSLAAMDPAPWIEHFTKTAGETDILSSRPQPVVLKKKDKKNTGDSRHMLPQGNGTLPLTIVSPVGQSSQMAQADLNMEKDNSMLQQMPASLVGSGALRAEHTAAPPQPPLQGKKRKATPRSSTVRSVKRPTKSKKTTSRLRDIFS